MKSLCSSIIVLLTIAVGEAVAMTAPPADSIQEALHPTDAFSSKKIRQSFNPIFGNEKEANQIISFVSANLVLELTEDQLESLDGYVVVQFIVDTAGLIVNPSISKSYAAWIDYTIIGAIQELPVWGVPSLKNGKPVERSHPIVFTFGTYVNEKQTYGLQNETIAQNTQNQINEQRNEIARKRREEIEEWQTYTDINSKIEYDIKDGLKNEATPLKDDDILRDPNGGSFKTPTITITQQD